MALLDDIKEGTILSLAPFLKLISKNNTAQNLYLSFKACDLKKKGN